MDIKVIIENGKNKISTGNMRTAMNWELPDKLFEIVGATEAHFYGTADLEDITEKDNDIEQVKYYYYKDFELTECSFGKAVQTSEFSEYKYLIFSQMVDYERIHYVTEILNCDEE